MQIRPIDLENDISTIAALWQSALGEQWPLPADVRGANGPDSILRQTLLTESGSLTGGFLAESGGEAVGFALTQARGIVSARGGLLAIGVRPEHRRRGIGRALLDSAVRGLRESGIDQIQLGSGGLRYFWPGVPCNLPGAWAFFSACGWQERERSYDLTRTLDDYTTPAWVFERPRRKGVTLRRAEAGEAGPVCAWVDARVSGWTRFYRSAFAEDRAGEVLLAFLPGGELAGVCLAERQEPLWRHLCAAGRRAGTPGAVFVDESAREQGIGLALVAMASEELREDGCGVSFLGWTWLVEWYGLLGYNVWQTYVMSGREFCR